MRIIISLALPAWIFACTPQPSQPDHAQTPQSASEPAAPEVSVYGALRDMFHRNQIGPRVSLGTLLPDSHLYGVGALANLRGEVTIVAGTVYLSYPDDPSSLRTEVVTTTDESATLFVAARVPRWTTLTVDRTVPFAEIDTVVADLARAAGHDLRARIPFVMEGTFNELHWHVIDGTRLQGGGASHHDHLAAAVKLERDQATATLVGFYSQQDQGAFTHMGSRTHIHAVVEGEDVSAGHVDHVVIPAGTPIRFPALGR
jgi:alpha-acetolactate decarboxylase